jgi:hypothetical protein
VSCGLQVSPRWGGPGEPFEAQDEQASPLQVTGRGKPLPYNVGNQPWMICYTRLFGAVPKWPKGEVCKTSIRGFESHPRLQDFKALSWVWPASRLHTHCTVLLEAVESALNGTFRYLRRAWCLVP